MIQQAGGAVLATRPSRIILQKNISKGMTLMCVVKAEAMDKAATTVPIIQKDGGLAASHQDWMPHHGSQRRICALKEVNLVLLSTACWTIVSFTRRPVRSSK